MSPFATTVFFLNVSSRESNTLMPAWSVVRPFAEAVSPSITLREEFATTRPEKKWLDRSRRVMRLPAAPTTSPPARTHARVLGDRDSMVIEIDHADVAWLIRRAGGELRAVAVDHMAVQVECDVVGADRDAVVGTVDEITVELRAHGDRGAAAQPLRGRQRRLRSGRSHLERDDERRQCDQDQRRQQAWVEWISRTSFQGRSRLEVTREVPSSEERNALRLSTATSAFSTPASTAS